MFSNIDHREFIPVTVGLSTANKQRNVGLRGLKRQKSWKCFSTTTRYILLITRARILLCGLLFRKKLAGALRWRPEPSMEHRWGAECDKPWGYYYRGAAVLVLCLWGQSVLRPRVLQRRVFSGLDANTVVFNRKTAEIYCFIS